ncbi:MAG TPA: TMEM175 family protein, partial [Anaerolineales bacterium]
MEKGRLEAFSDGVIAILITIMVLELKVPHGADWASLVPLLPIFLSYVLSFVFMIHFGSLLSLLAQLAIYAALL